MIVAYRAVKEFCVVQVKLTKPGEERVNRLVPQNKCLACEDVIAEGEKTVCGCCVWCDQVQRYGVRTGKTSFKQLIADGERLPPKPGGRKPSSKYAAKLLGRDDVDQTPRAKSRKSKV